MTALFVAATGWVLLWYVIAVALKLSGLHFFLALMGGYLILSQLRDWSAA